MVFIRAADCSDPKDSFECPDCHGKKVKIERGIRVTVWCADCGRIIVEMDASEWRGRYEPPL